MSFSDSPPPEPALDVPEPVAHDAADSTDSASDTRRLFPARSGIIPSTKTPPNRSSIMPPAQDTPIHYKTIAAKVHSAANNVVRNKEYIEIGRDMYEHIVGPVPTEHFLSDVMTVQTGNVNARLRRIRKITKEKDLVRPFC